jgi:hypothetical protein
MTDRPADDALPPALARVFAPLHKRAFGMAFGLACALVMFGVTAGYLLRQPSPGFELGLLGQFFYGYTVSWSGAFVGAAWAFVVGFVAGWFFAFCRNLFIATWIFVTRERAALEQGRDFLDHI